MAASANDERRLVALETSGRVGSVAVGTGPTPTLERRFSSQRRHAVELLPTVVALCDEVGWPAGSVTHVAISAGPGSFTGLRVGFALARAWARFLSARLCPVPTLEVITANLLPGGCGATDVVTMLDAKRGQVYAAVSRCVSEQPARVETREGPGVYEPAALLSRVGRPFVALGEAFQYMPHLAELVQRHGGRVAEASLWPARAEWVYRLAWGRLASPLAGAGPEEALPVYVRLPEAEERWQAAHDPQEPPHGKVVGG